MRNVLLASTLVVALCGSAYAQHMPTAGVWQAPANGGLNWTPPQPYTNPAVAPAIIVPNYYNSGNMMGWTRGACVWGGVLMPC